MVLLGIYCEMFFCAPNISSSWKVRERTNKKKVRGIWPVWFGRHLWSHKNPTRKWKATQKHFLGKSLEAHKFQKWKFWELLTMMDILSNQGCFQHKSWQKLPSLQQGANRQKGYTDCPCSVSRTGSTKSSVSYNWNKMLAPIASFPSCLWDRIGNVQKQSGDSKGWKGERSLLCVLTSIIDSIK